MSTLIKRRALKQRGLATEDAVCEFLRERGYTVVERNFTMLPLKDGANAQSGGEVDIIAVKGVLVAFVEVKRRGNANYVHADLVSAGQKRRIIAAADRFFETHEEFAECAARFDVAAVCDDVVDYAEDVFEKGLFL